MTEKKIEIFDTEEELAVSLARYTADLSGESIKAKGAFAVVLSGDPQPEGAEGTSVRRFCGLVQMARVPAGREGCPKTHPDSNYKLALDGADAVGAAEDYETCVRQLVLKNVVPLSTATGFPKFDLMLLGMGPDEHVASLFPGHPLVDENERWVTYIKDSPKPPPERITFTFPVINSSEYMAVMVAGPGEIDAVGEVLGNGADGDGLPARMVLAEGELIWFLDKDAASKL